MKKDNKLKSFSPENGYHEVSQSSSASTPEFDSRLTTHLHYESHGFAVAVTWLSFFILILSLVPLYDYLKFKNNYNLWEKQDYFIVSNTAIQCLLLPFNLLAEIKHKASLYLVAAFYYIGLCGCCYFVLNNPFFALIAFLVLCFYAFAIIKITRHKMYAKTQGAIKIGFILGGYI